MPAPEYLILRELIARESEWVSGSALALRLGTSRVAVWHHMEKLRAQGFDFEARRAKGYRLAGVPAGLHRHLIEAQLKVRRRGFSVLVHAEVGSTNDEAARELEAGRSAPFAILAQRQTRGRGRFGRNWHSESNGNLYASFGFRPPVPPDRMRTFTLWMGVNICELIANFTGLKPGLKWPNDIVFEGRKAGGILTEARIDADRIRDLVFGLGLNVNSQPGQWPAELGRRAVSLAELAGRPFDLNRLTAALLGRVLLAYESFVDRRDAENFAELWHRYDILRGRKVALLGAGARHEGTVLGIDDEGSLLLRDERGRRQRFRAGEVTLEKQP